MKVLSINSVPYGSTCNIMAGISELASKEYDVIVATGFSRHPVEFHVEHLRIGGAVDKCVHILLAKTTGYNGCFSTILTLAFLSKLNKLQPDILHLHNLHNCYINLPMLFNYIKKHKIPIVWTLHDCWAFTGQCPHFTMVKCDKWKTGCNHCPQYKEYPKSFVDRTETMWKLKKKWFTGVENMTIVTPSQWLADLVKQSYLKEYPVKVINNGINLNIFKPTLNNFREKYKIPTNKYILLGVAFGWGKRKGLDVFVELSKRLDEEIYQIVLVGTDDNIDKQLPGNIISIHRTQNQKELAEIYTAADLFVNPTREENYPTVNMEALACGTPVLTFNTGGSPESLDETCGAVVDGDDIDALEREIILICEAKPYTQESCLKKAKEFDMNDRFEEYVDLYTSKRKDVWLR